MTKNSMEILKNDEIFFSTKSISLDLYKISINNDFNPSLKTLN